jgi:hypothetical protein
METSAPVAMTHAIVSMHRRNMHDALHVFKIDFFGGRFYIVIRLLGQIGKVFGPEQKSNSMLEGHVHES